MQNKAIFLPVRQETTLHDGIRFFGLTAHLLPGKNILKVKRDFRNSYWWVLAQNNEVYRINSTTLAVDNYTSRFATYSGIQFIDIAGRSQNTVFIATNSTKVIEYKKGVTKVIVAADGITTAVNLVGIAKIPICRDQRLLRYVGIFKRN